nr:MAG TPA: hypothetical protein [Caudoviricetes sp.]
MGRVYNLLFDIHRPPDMSDKTLLLLTALCCLLSREVMRMT